MDTPRPDMPSTFVTVVAWVFIVFSALGVLMTTAQNVMLSLMPAFTESADAGFLERNFRILFVIPWVLSALMLVASAGLLKRREWARKTFIGLLSLGVLYLAGSLALIGLMDSGSPPEPPGASPEFQEMSRQLEIMHFGMEVLTIILVVLFSGVFIWIIRRLMQPSVCAEFDTWQ